MDKKLEKALNGQLNFELYSAYIYLSMSAYLEAENLPGSSHWMNMQIQEELLHVGKLFNFLNERSVKVNLEAVDKPPAKFSSMEDVFKKTLAHEQVVTTRINNLYSLAEKTGDNATKIFLQWFINEQVEEEKAATDVLGKLKHIKSQPAGILILDNELATRPQPVLSPAADTKL